MEAWESVSEREEEESVWESASVSEREEELELELERMKRYYSGHSSRLSIPHNQH